MKDNKIIKVVEKILILMIILIIGLLIVKAEKEKKIEKLASLQKATIVSKQLKPMIKANSVRTITCSSRVILEEIRSRMLNKYPQIVRSYVTPTVNGLYYLDLDNNYFSSNNYGYLYTLNVSGKDVGSLDTLPDFRSFGINNFNFSNCNISDLRGIANAVDKGYMNLGNKPQINLQGNHISSVPKSIRSNNYYFDLRNQRIEIDLGSVNKGSVYEKYLPGSIINYTNSFSCNNCSVLKEFNKIGMVRFNTNNSGRNVATVSINDSSSIINGTKIIYHYMVMIVPERYAIDKWSNSSTNNNEYNNEYNNTYNYIPEVKKITIYAEAKLENSNLSQSKNINIKVTGENADLANAGIFVNGKEISHNYGNATYKVTQNGSYKITITYPGINNINLNIDVGCIDKVKPSYTYTTKMNEGSNEKYLTIIAKDDRCLKSVAVNGKNIYKCDNKNWYSALPIQYTVNKTGNYIIRVEDFAGNYYENTEIIEIDTTAPKVTNLMVGRNNELWIGNSKSTTGEKYCAATIGSDISIIAETDEYLGGFEDMYINRLKLNKADYQYEVKNKAIFINLKLTKEIIQYYRMAGFVEIAFSNISDKWGNKAPYHDNSKLYVSITKPVISDVIITGGTLNKTKDIIEIYMKQNIRVTFLVNKKLFSTPKVAIIVPTETSIPGQIYDELFYTFAEFKEEIQKDGSTYYKYGVDIGTSSIMKCIRNLRGHLTLCVRNCFDSSGNISDMAIIDKDNKSSNGVSLVYGKAETGAIYLAGETKSTNEIIGDINSDGYINEYDYLLLSRYLAEKEEFSEKEETLANVDSNDVVDQRDLKGLQEIIKREENYLPLNSEIKFKAYNDDNEQLTGENLTAVLENGEEHSQVRIVNDEINIITSQEGGSLKIKTTYLQDSGYEELVGRLTFKIEEKIETKGEFEVVSENKNNRFIMGDVNNDGYITKFDSIMIQRYLAEYIDLTSEQKQIADVYKDGIVSINDATVIQKMEQFNYIGMKNGDKIKLKFSSKGKSFSSLKDDTIENQISWYATGDSSAVTITECNEEGTAEISINENADENSKVSIICRVKIDESEFIISEFNIIVINSIEVKLSDSEIAYDLSNLEENNNIINATTNISNRPITWNISDERVAKLRINKFGDIEVVPLKSGTADITATVDGVTETCKVNIIQTIQNIETEENKIEVKESQEKDINISIEPVTTTEEVRVISEDENIVKVYKADDGSYKALGIKEGNTNINITTSSDEEIKETIEVEVKAIEKPIINGISVGDVEKTYKPGEKLEIRINFTEKVIGEAPNLNIGFGKYASKNPTRFLGFENDDKTLLYEYTIKSGDNGMLILYRLDGGSLTDSTGKIDADLTLNPDYYSEDEEISFVIFDDELIKSISVSDENESNQNNTIESNENEETPDSGNLITVSSGLYRAVEEIDADTNKPEIKIVADVDKDSYWLKEGDIAKIKIISNEELQGVPEVIMGGKEAEVYGEGTEFIASIPVTNDIAEGTLEIKVKQYKDLAGNEGVEVVAKEENIEEPIVIDNSGTKIDKIILIKEKNKEYKAGDKLYIRLFFADKTVEKEEYISASIVPELNILFGGNEAKGEIENDYIGGEYVNNILYTYTISDQDRGNISINKITGKVIDIAGNETEFLGDEEIPIIKEVEVEKENAEQNEKNNNSDTKDNSEINSIQDVNDKNNKREEENQKLFGVLPYTGATVLSIVGILIGIISIISGTIFFVIKRR